jgi:hypothetical protein
MQQKRYNTTTHEATWTKPEGQVYFFCCTEECVVLALLWEGGARKVKAYCLFLKDYVSEVVYLARNILL